MSGAEGTRAARRRQRVALGGVTAGLLFAVGGCLDVVDYNKGNIDWDSTIPPTGDPNNVPPYDGDNEIVQAAQDLFPTGLDFHQDVIWRTCTPNEGVCHNSKEYPDLRTPGTFTSTFGAPCNVQPGEWSSVFDGCERPGDRLRLDGGGFEFAPNEIAWIDFIAPTPADDCQEQFPDDYAPTGDSPGLHIKLRNPIPSDQTYGYATAYFLRTFVVQTEEGSKVEDSVFGTYGGARWWVVAGEPDHIVAAVCNYQTDDLADLLEVGVEQGDMNRNGSFGIADLDEPDQLIRAGRPEESYLIARVRGSMRGDNIPGTPMPLANQPLSNIEMLAFFCLVQGFDPTDPVGLAAGIDYNSCSYSDNPEDLDQFGSGTTWTGRVSKIIRYNCASCHSGEEPAADLNLFQDEVGLEGVYMRLLEPSDQEPTMDLVSPGAPDQSYMYWKITGHPDIKGAPMPYNPLTGKGALAPGEVADIEAWILAGATAD